MEPEPRPTAPDDVPPRRWRAPLVRLRQSAVGARLVFESVLIVASVLLGLAEHAAALSETYLLQRNSIGQTIQRLADRFSSPQNFDPATRRTMLLTHRMLLVELSGQESFLIGSYRRALKQLPPPER